MNERIQNKINDHSWRDLARMIIIPKYQQSFGIIYIWTHRITKKSYVGKSSGKLISRTRKHISDAMSGKSNSCFHNIIQTDLEFFDVSVLYQLPKDVLKSKIDSLLNTQEIKFITTLNTLDPYGYNSTTGGEGSICSDSLKKKLSVANRYQIIPKEQIEKTKIKVKNYHKYHRCETTWKKRCKDHAKKVAKRVVCLNNNVTYESGSDAARKLQIKPNGIRDCCNGIAQTYKGLKFCYADEKNKKQRIIRIAKTVKVKCLTNGIIYSSAVDASNKLNLSKTYVRKSCREKIKVKHGLQFEYVDMILNESTGRNVRGKNKNILTVIGCIETKEKFQNVKECARHFKVSTKNVKRCVEDKTENIFGHHLIRYKIAN